MRGTSPKLRFPEFNEPWRPTSVASLLERQSEPVDVDLTQNYRQIGVRSHGRGIFHKDAVTGAELGDKRVFNVVQNALVVNIVFAWEQAVALTSEADAGFIASHRFPMFTEKNGKSYLPFLRHMFLTKRGKLLLEIASPGGAGRNKTLGQQEFLKLKPVVPNRAEQKKIADTIDSVDAKLAALAARQAALGWFKAGLMQKLFSQQLRFTQDSGEAFPDWQEKRLGAIADISKGKQLNRDTLAEKEGYPVINGGTAPSGYHPEFNTNGNTITISEGGNSCGYVAWQAEPFWCGGHCYTTSPNGAEIVNEFLFQGLKFEEVSIKRLRVGSGLPNIQKGDLAKVIVPLPHPDEQARIADALSAMDGKIQAVAGQIAKLETFKKGLLQQMFV